MGLAQYQCIHQTKKPRGPKDDATRPMANTTTQRALRPPDDKHATRQQKHTPERHNDQVTHLTPIKYTPGGKQLAPFLIFPQAPKSNSSLLCMLFPRVHFDRRPV